MRERERTRNGNEVRLWHWQWPFQLLGWPRGTATFSRRNERNGTARGIHMFPIIRTNNGWIRRVWQRRRWLLLIFHVKTILHYTDIIWFHVLHSVFHDEYGFMYVLRVCVRVVVWMWDLQSVEFRTVLNNGSPRSFIVILFNETTDNTGYFVKFNFARASFDVSHECDGSFWRKYHVSLFFFFFKLAFAICNNWDTNRRKKVKIGLNVTFRIQWNKHIPFHEKYKKLKESKNLSLLNLTKQKTIDLSV